MRTLGGLLVVALLLMACEVGYVAQPEAGPRPADLTAELLAGEWRNEQRDGTIVFAADGTMEILNLPPEELETMNGVLSPSFDKTWDRIDSRGEWSFDNDPAGASSRQSLVTISLPKSGFVTGYVDLMLEGYWFGNRPALVFHFGDPDLDVTYVYLKAWPSPSPAAS